jgi:cysteine-rich repeat protein
MARTSLLFCTAVFVIACGDPPEVGTDGGRDAGGSGGCSESAPCEDGFACVDGVCVAGSCGDTITDSSLGEQCDDGNSVAFDGCEPDCTFTCEDSAECADPFECNGAESCNDAHVCVSGTSLEEGAACTRAGGDPGVCRGGVECVPPGCGNGAVEGAEECDDMNAIEADGCDNDCTFSCTDAADCTDADVCTGEETCDAMHRCVAGTPMVCDDANACTMNLCDPADGCDFSVVIDGDGDGRASTELGACGDDCDDANASVFPGAEELCDGIDNNCIDGADESAPLWYVDCDNDNYAASDAGATRGCNEPPPTGCGGGWTTTRPVDTTNTDCHDGNATVRPGPHRTITGAERYYTTSFTTPTGGTSWDYNCNNSGTSERQFGCVSSTTACTSCNAVSSGPNGFVCSSPPSCGTSASYSTCEAVFCGSPPCTGDPCRRTSAPRVQGCR